MITKPTLPPKAGYVERTDENGNRYYAPTIDTILKQNQENELKEMKEALNAILSTIGTNNDSES